MRHPCSWGPLPACGCSGEGLAWGPRAPGAEAPPRSVNRGSSGQLCPTLPVQPQESLAGGGCVRRGQPGPGPVTGGLPGRRAPDGAGRRRLWLDHHQLRPWPAGEGATGGPRAAGRGGGAVAHAAGPGLSAPVRAQYSFSGEWIQPLEETLVGALDMGGASTQITFVPGGPILDKTTQATFHLYGANHTVYTHSYLCFGRDQALSRLLAELVQVGLRPGGRAGGWPGRGSERIRPPAGQPGPPGPSPLLPQRLPGHAGPGVPV